MLSQYGLVYALDNDDDVARLMILNTPVGLGSKLRPELAAYKNPIAFLRPGNVSGRAGVQLPHRAAAGTEGTCQHWTVPCSLPWLAAGHQVGLRMRRSQRHHQRAGTCSGC